MYHSSGRSSDGESNLIGMSRDVFEEPYSGTQHHVAALERTLGLMNVIIVFPTKDRHHLPLCFDVIASLRSLAAFFTDTKSFSQPHLSSSFDLTRPKMSLHYHNSVVTALATPPLCYLDHPHALKITTCIGCGGNP